jgi:hypothetical protein
MEVSGQLYASAALSPGRAPLVPITGGWVGPRADLDAVMGIELQLDYPARSSALYH